MYPNPNPTENAINEEPSAIGLSPERNPGSCDFKAALNKLKLKPSECLMVGDWPERDIKGAKSIGMRTCFARYGNPKIKKTDADYEISNIKMLLEIVK